MRDFGSGFTDEAETAFDGPVFVISVAAQLAGMHPQTLRQYDRLGLVQPGRSPGGGRRYSASDVVMLREIARLSQDEGVNLAGVKRIIDLTRKVRELTEQVEALDQAVRRAEASLAEAQASLPSRAELVPLSQSILPVWRPTAR
ncbi:MAG TPA: helix-turn-helix transcriptional regulator [Cryptosporangiaceae bacterium]|nr:helix-turn-helix transcriptional regulator [Cryptosporangiaceae bacterium]